MEFLIEGRGGTHIAKPLHENWNEVPAFGVFFRKVKYLHTGNVHGAFDAFCLQKGGILDTQSFHSFPPETGHEFAATAPPS